MSYHAAKENNQYHRVPEKEHGYCGYKTSRPGCKLTANIGRNERVFLLVVSCCDELIIGECITQRAIRKNDQHIGHAEQQNCQHDHESTIQTLRSDPFAPSRPNQHHMLKWNPAGNFTNHDQKEETAHGVEAVVELDKQFFRKCQLQLNACNPKTTLVNHALHDAIYHHTNDHGQNTGRIDPSVKIGKRHLDNGMIVFYFSHE